MAKTKLIVNLTRGECICVGELADRPLLRMRGLIGRRGLPAGEGMLLWPAPGIHTAFMRFPIDALFLDRHLRVLDIVEQLRPWRMASKHRARAVLELPAGECARRMVEVGDRLELRDRTAVGAVETNGSGHASGSTMPGQLGDLTRLQPLRVLVISPDRHYRTVMSLLLARHNCSVTTTAKASRAAGLVGRESPDVVVIDASKEAAAVAVGAVGALARPVGVVVVSDEVKSPAPESPLLSKWGPFADLLAAVEEADARRDVPGDGHDRA
jgi:uncharacterized membrane protein (UPF0127 family)